MHYGIGGNQHCSAQTDLSLLGNVASSTYVTISSGVQTDFPQQCGKQLSLDYSIEFLSCMFARVCEELGLKTPKDFLMLTSSAMVRLSEISWSNILYNLAKGIGIGTMREDGLDSRFPTQRMPMGLEYTAKFFIADDLNQVLPNYSVLVCFIIIIYSDSNLSSRLSSVAADNVLPVWSEMGKTPWAHVACCTIFKCS